MNIITNKNIYIRLNSSKKIRVSEFLYISAISIYLIDQMFYKTMFNVHMRGEITLLINFITLAIILYKIVMFDKYTLKKLILVITVFTLSIISYFKSGYNTLFYLPILIIGAKDVNFNIICRVYLIIAILIVVISALGVKLNIIEHIVYFRNGKYRYAFGSVYATDFAARMFYLCVVYCFLKYTKFNIIDTIIFIIIGSFTLYFCGARLDSISIFLLGIVPIIGKRIQNNQNNNGGISKIVQLLVTFSIPVFATISIIVTNLYTPSSKLFVWLNKVFTDRLILGKRGIEEYGFSLFGQTIDMVGNGGVNGRVSNYFFIDSSYLFIALRYGTIVLVMICLFYAIFMKKRMQCGDLLLPIVIIVIGINSIVAHHFLDIAYNPFVLVFLSNLDSIKYKIENRMT